MPLPRLLRRGVGWLLIVIALLLVPVSWTAAVILHARACESWSYFVLHQALISLSPQTALLLFAVGDDLTHRR